ncbi:MAG: hypothetical protein DRQ01_01425 [Ignavibacteriae bacterium]|nr:MAG: hypothetical protein DRQ01_01425 [Ignavibacteriota bacterium]
MITETNTKISFTEMQESFEWLADNLQINVFKTKLDGTVLYVNDYTRKAFEFDSMEEIYATNIAGMYKCENDRNLFLQELTKSSEVKSFETELITKSGKIKNMVVSAVLNGDVISGMAIDVTDSKKAKETVENSLSILRSTLESTTDGILVVDRDGKVEDFNQRFIKMWKIPAELAETKEDEKLIKFVLDQLIDPDGFVKKIQKLNADLSETSFDILEFKDGRVFERYSRPQKKDDMTVGRIWTFRDATEQNIARKKLDENVLKYKTLFDTANDAIFLMNKEFFIDCNSKTLDMFGCTREDILGETPFRFSPLTQPDGCNSEENGIELLSKAYDGQPMFFEWKHCKLDGTQFDTEVSLNKVRLNNEDMVQAIVRDITERKRSEILQDAVYKISQTTNAARDLNHLYSEIHKTISGFINAKNFYIALFDSENNLLSFPYFIDEHDEMPSPQKPGRGLTEYVIRKGEPVLADPDTFNNLVNSGEVERILTDSIDWLGVPLKTTEKTIGAIVVQTYSEKYRYSDQDKEFLSFVSDQTAMAIERTIAEEELIKAKDKAEEMNRLKTSFLANMSHELRTPMVGILGYTEILKREIADPELREMSGEIFTSANRLLETLNLILDLSKIEANKSEIKAAEINVGNVTVNQVKCFEELARKKNLYLKTILVDEHVYSLLDERIFRQVINNLISNALKFTDKGSITVIVDKKQSGNKEGAVITVIDSGIGIPQKSQQIIFEEFRQVSEGLERTFEGSGLGLSITKRFVELMDGEISVESEIGKGSVFTVSFPLYKKEEKIFDTKITHKEEPVLQDSLHKKYKKQLPEVLLVEDDPSNAGVIEYFLENVCDLDIANTGELALEMTSKKQYSVILMDIDLGRGMSGIEATKQIRKMEGYENLPIVAVTALAMRGQKELFLSEGCTHYISKPFESKIFVSLIKEIIYNGNPEK